MTWVWIGFALFILAMLAIDLLRKEGEVSLKEAGIWSCRLDCPRLRFWIRDLSLLGPLASRRGAARA